MDGFYIGSNLENADINKFIENSDSENIVEVTIRFLSDLSEKWNCKWPYQLIEMYIVLFIQVR